MSQRLSALDTAFLQVEDSENRMQLAGVLLFRGPVPDFPTFRKTVADRLLGLPHFRQRVRGSSLGLARPAWVEDDAFDIDCHVSRTALPSPGGHDEVAAHIDQLSTAPLDMARPLWEVALVEGVEGGFAISLKVHHCMVDGLSIIDIVTALLAPDSRIPERAAKPAATLTASSAQARRPAATGALERLRDLGGLGGLLTQAPPSPFNSGPSGPTRRTSYVTVPFQHVHDIRRSYGTTVNNTVLAVVTGALRRYLQRHDALVDRLHAFVPVNRRSDDARGDLGNQIAMTYPALPVGEETLDGRVEGVIEGVDRAARERHAATTGTLMRLLDLAPAPLAATLNRTLQLHTAMFNLTITNVPGPPVPVQFLGAELELVLGCTPLTSRHALTVAVLTYHDTLTFMVTTDPRRVPDGADIADDLQSELADLHAHVTHTTHHEQGSQR